MKRLLALLALLALPAAAPAKELGAAQVCGPQGCKDVTDRDHLIAAIERSGVPGVPPTEQAPFFRVKVRIHGDPMTHVLLVSPQARRLRGFDRRTWFLLAGAHLKTWTEVVRGVEPFPAAQLPGVDPDAPLPTNTSGSLPPQPYEVAPAGAPAEDGSFPWWIPVAVLAGAGALALMRRVRLLRPSSRQAA